MASMMSCSVESSLRDAEKAGIVLGSKLRVHTESDSSRAQKYSLNTSDWQFAHNSIHEAMLRIVGGRTEQDKLHLMIGRTLMSTLTEKELNKDILAILDQILKGAAFIKERERHQFAHLALQAAQNAFYIGSFQSARKSINFALSMIREKSWRDEYNLTLAAHNVAAEVSYTIGDSDHVDQMVSEVLRNARTFDDQLQANLMKMYALGSANRMPDALVLGFSLLEELGERFPKYPSNWQTYFSLFKTCHLLRGKLDSDLLGLPNMSESRALSSMQIMNILLTGMWWNQPLLAPLLIMRMVQLSLKHGLCAVSSIAFAYFGTFLAFMSSTRREGIRMCDLSFKILDRFKAKSWIPRVHAIVFSLVDGWTKPLHAAIDPLLRGYRIGMETGDIEVRTYSWPIRVLTPIITHV